MTDPVNRPIPLTVRQTTHPLTVRSWRVPALAGVAALGLLLAGCSGGGEDGGGESSPGASASASPEGGSTSESPTAGASGSDGGASGGSASPSESGPFEPASSTAPAKNVPVPEMPEAVKEPTESGVEAALEHWWEAGYYLQLTGDPKPLESISAQSCVICEELIKDWTGIYGAGGWSTGADPSLPKSVFSLEGEGKSATMVFESIEGPSSLYKSGGEEVDPENADRSFRASWSGMATYDSSREQWVIDEVIAQGDLEAEK
jgi:hypothetical protein